MEEPTQKTPTYPENTNSYMYVSSASVISKQGQDHHVWYRWVLEKSNFKVSAESGNMSTPCATIKVQTSLYWSICPI